MLRGKSPGRISRSVQRYFPQCAACCSKQAAAVRSGTTCLVLHFYGMRPWYYAGKSSPQPQCLLHSFTLMWPSVRSLLQQAGSRCEEWHHTPGAPLLWHAAIISCRQGGFPLRLTPTAILTAWRIDVCVLGLCGHCLPSNHDAENGRHGCRNRASF